MVTPTESQPVSVLSLLDQTMEHSWVPLGMKATLNQDGTVSIMDLNKSQVQCKIISVIYNC